MQVKCISCGAFQNISENQNCNYCNSLIELESGKSNYEKTANSEIGNLIIIAETAVEAENWDEALQFFNQVLVKDISNPDVWLGKGIAMVYLSKIGDLKIKEAIAYWKNAIKYASNQEAMSKRVAKEIDEVVNKFYPVLENHFFKFRHLDNSFEDLVEKFIVLETAQDYAVQLSPNDVKYSLTGYKLCKRVIELPYSSTFLVGDDNSRDINKKFSQRKIKTVFPLEKKYITNIQKLDTNSNIVSSEEILTKANKQSEQFVIIIIVVVIVVWLLII